MVGSARSKVIELDDASVRVVEETLQEAFGRTTKELILSLLEKNYSLKREEMPGKTEELQRALEKLFGTGTARVTVGLVVERLQMAGQIELK